MEETGKLPAVPKEQRGFIEPVSATAPSRWQELDQAFERARKIALNAVAVLAVALVAYAIVWEAFSGSYSTDPIAIPDQKSKSRFDGEALAAQLKDAVSIAWRGGRSSEVFRLNSEPIIRPLAPDRGEPTLNLTGTTISLRYFATLIRNIFGSAATRITGEMTLLAPLPGDQADIERVRLILRTSDNEGPFFDRVGNYTDIISSAGIEILLKIDPLAGAGVLSANDPLRALTIVESFSAGLKKTELPVWAVRSLPVTSQLPRLELTFGNIYLAMGQDSLGLAKAHFGRANEEYKLRNLAGQDWYAAQDGLATVAIYEVGDNVRADFEAGLREARAYVERALTLEPQYDSALYHDAEISDRHSRRLFEQLQSGGLPQPEACRASEIVEDALRRYAKLLAAYPDFTYAYPARGVMLIQQLSWVRVHDLPQCLRERHPDKQAFVMELEKRVMQTFREALARDAKSADVYLQWGIMLMERRKEPTEQRANTLKEAIDKLSRATNLKPENWYVWFRLAQAQAERAKLGYKDATKEQVRLSFCRALENNNDEVTISMVRGEMTSFDPSAQCTK
jgi:tetratricopeptide (TPR) repeat protein